jgi:hypothetical protein
MKTERKFFDEKDNEVSPEKASYCVELSFDSDGRLVKSVRFNVENKVEEGENI